MKTLPRLALLAFGTACTVLSAKAQDDYQLPVADCLRPTPQASALLRYVEFPVSTATGIPEISIPIFTIGSGDLQMPISLSYHAGGLRSSDIATNVGLGWTLNCGGSITRIVKGNPDTAATEVPDAATLPYGLETIKVKGYNTSMKDTYYDSFFYTFDGHSGEFMVHPNSFEITQLTPSDNKIVAHREPSFVYGPSKFTITTPDGSVYEFAAQEYVSTSHTTTVSDWQLTKVVNYNRTDSLVFTYAAEPDWTNESTTVELREYAPIDAIPQIYPIRTFYSNCKRLASISCRSGQVDFEYAMDRKETGTPKSRLVNIRYKDRSGRQIQKAELDNDAYFSGPRLKLRGIRIVGKNNETIDRRKFSYLHEEENVPLTSGCDLFGYYNGSRSISDSRDYSFYHASMFVLERIEQPTGGYTRFAYEPNTIKAPVIGTNFDDLVIESHESLYDTIPLSLGIRIAEIESVDKSSGASLTRSFEYDDTIATIDFSKVTASCYLSSYMLDATKDYLAAPIFTSVILSSHSSMPEKSIEGTRLYHCRVTERRYGKTGEELKTVYTYGKVGDMFAYADVGAGWVRVMDNLQLGYIKIFNAGDGYNPFSCRGIFIDRGYFPNVDWMYGCPQTKSVYTLDNGQYRLVEKTNYHYNKINEEHVRTGFYCQVSKRQDRVGPFTLEGDCYFNIDRIIGRYVLEYTTTSKMLETGAVGESRSYTYAETPEGIQTGLPRTEEVSRSSITVHTKNHVYPFDNRDGLSKTLKEAWRLTPPLRTDFVRNDATIATQEIEYDRVDGVVVPRFVRFLKNGYGAHYRQIYNYDSHFNPTCLSLDGQSPTIYIWGYDWSEPVAEIRNATYEELLALDTSGMLERIGARHDLSIGSPEMMWLKGLRQRLPEALITLYTYLPGIGITSVNDPSGRTTYYEYDGANRLATVRDEEGNILEAYEYHYRQTE